MRSSGTVQLSVGDVLVAEARLEVIDGNVGETNELRKLAAQKGFTEFNRFLFKFVTIVAVLEGWERNK